MHSALAWVIWYTGTGTNNASNSFQVSTCKLKSKLTVINLQYLVIRYTGTSTNNPSNSFQVSTCKLKSKLNKFTVSGPGLVYESKVLKHCQYRRCTLYAVNCLTNPCHVWIENVPLVHLNVKFRHWHKLVYWCTRNMSLSQHFRMEGIGKFLCAPHRKGPPKYFAQGPQT